MTSLFWRAASFVVAAALCSSAVSEAPALEKKAYPLHSGDWLEVDRKRFQALSTQLDGPQLINAVPAVITFADAARYNTAHVKSGEYTDVETRNAYYSLISLVIEFDRNTPQPVRGVRFFHATTLVTLWTQVGAIDAVDNTFCLNMSQDTRSFLREVNKRLFASNLPVINKLLHVWKEPRDPSGANANTVIAPWEFDKRMVKVEQAVVEDAIKDLKPPAAVRSEISALNNCVLSYIGTVAMRGGTDQWVREAVGSPDFFNAKHRRAIGYSIITAFHKKSKADFIQTVKDD